MLDNLCKWEDDNCKPFGSDIEECIDIELDLICDEINEAAKKLPRTKKELLNVKREERKNMKN